MAYQDCRKHGGYDDHKYDSATQGLSFYLFAYAIFQLGVFRARKTFVPNIIISGDARRTVRGYVIILVTLCAIRSG